MGRPRRWPSPPRRRCPPPLPSCSRRCSRSWPGSTGRRHGRRRVALPLRLAPGPARGLAGPSGRPPGPARGPARRYGILRRHLDRAVGLLPAAGMRALRCWTAPAAGRHEQRWPVCLSTDLAGYATLTESMHDRQPALAALIADYRALLYEVVERRGGRFGWAGDASMSAWLAGRPTPRCAPEPWQPPWNSRRSSSTCRQAGIDAHHTRVGLAEGEIVMGNLAAGDRFSFGAVGEPLNVATRLEQLNKQLGTRVLATRGVVDGLADLRLRAIGPVRCAAAVSPTRSWRWSRPRTVVFVRNATARGFRWVNYGGGENTPDALPLRHPGALVAILLVLPELAAAAERCAVPAGHIAAVEDLVEVAAGADWTRLALGEPLCVGDTLRAGENGRSAVILASGAVLRLARAPRSGSSRPSPASAPCSSSSPGSPASSAAARMRWRSTPPSPTPRSRAPSSRSRSSPTAPGHRARGPGPLRQPAGHRPRRTRRGRRGAGRPCPRARAPHPPARRRAVGPLLPASARDPPPRRRPGPLARGRPARRPGPPRRGAGPPRPAPPTCPRHHRPHPPRRASPGPGPPRRSRDRLAEALTRHPRNADALALRAVIAVAAT